MRAFFATGNGRSAPSTSGCGLQRTRDKLPREEQQTGLPHGLKPWDRTETVGMPTGIATFDPPVVCDET